MIDTPRRLALRSLILVAALAVTACGASATATPAATPAPTTAAAATAPGSAGPATPRPPAALAQAWASAELTDVATGEVFSIAGLAAAGKTIILETMAVWCTNCLGQQQRIEEALGRVDRSTVAYVVLTVDPSEDASRLAAYRAQHAFDGLYAVAGRDLSRALAADFGDQVLNPPSTPVVLISPSGRVTLTPFGGKSVDQIVSLVEDHRA